MKYLFASFYRNLDVWEQIRTQAGGEKQQFICRAFPFRGAPIRRNELEFIYEDIDIAIATHVRVTHDLTRSLHIQGGIQND